MSRRNAVITSPDIFDCVRGAHNLIKKMPSVPCLVASSMFENTEFYCCSLPFIYTSYVDGMIRISADHLQMTNGINLYTWS